MLFPASPCGQYAHGDRTLLALARGDVVLAPPPRASTKHITHTVPYLFGSVFRHTSPIPGECSAQVGIHSLCGTPRRTLRGTHFGAGREAAPTTS